MLHLFAFRFTDKMEESLSPALRDQHILLYMHDIVSEYLEHLQATIAKLRDLERYNLDLCDELETEDETSEIEIYIELLNSLSEVFAFT